MCGDIDTTVYFGDSTIQDMQGGYSIKDMLFQNGDTEHYH